MDRADGGVALLRNIDGLLSLADQHRQAYANADPFPHGTFGGLFDTEFLAAVVAELPSRVVAG